MKNFKILLTGFLVAGMVFMSADLSAKDSDDTLIEDIKTAVDSFHVAVEKHNYRAAKEQLNVLFPLMKREMKLVKKRIHMLEKEGSEAMASEMEEALGRKEEISDTMHGIVDASAAALRARADYVTTLLKEYTDLLSTKEQLLSLNR